MPVNEKAEFYYRSYCDKDIDGFTITTPNSFLGLTSVNDRRLNTYAITSGANNDATAASIDIDFGFDRSVDTLVLKSNAEDLRIYYSTDDGGYPASMLEWSEQTGLTSEFNIFNLSSISARYIRVEITTTLVQDNEKRVNFLAVTEKITDLYIENINIEQISARKAFNNIYGGSIQVIKYPNRSKISISLSWDTLADSEYTNYKTLKDRMLIDSINIYLYFSDTYTLLNSEAFYLVNDISNLENTPAALPMTAGVSTKMELRGV